MPSAFAHGLVGASLTAVLPRGSRPIWVAVAFAFLAAAPDLDVVAFRLGIPYEHDLGHRGLTHSLPFAVAIALASIPLWRRTLAERAGLAAALTFVAAASHGVLDAFTDAGLGIGLLVPFDSSRYFAPFRPLRTSPLSVRSFFSAEGVEILWNELLWLGPPTTLLVVCALAFRRAARLRD